jgi:hypothetical protein
VSEIQKWLESIAFDANEIGMDLLAQVDDQMLKHVGVSIGGPGSTAQIRVVTRRFGMPCRDRRPRTADLCSRPDGK